MCPCDHFRGIICDFHRDQAERRDRHRGGGDHHGNKPRDCKENAR